MLNSLAQIIQNLVPEQTNYLGKYKNADAFAGIIVEVWKKNLKDGHPQDLMDLLGGQRPIKANRIVSEIEAQVAAQLISQEVSVDEAVRKAKSMVEPVLQEFLTKANDSQNKVSVKTIVDNLLTDPELAEKYTSDGLLKRINPQGGGGGLFSGMVNKLDETIQENTK